MIDVGVIGLGYWGPNLVRNFARHPRTRVSVLCDIRPDVLAEAAINFPGVRTTTRFRSLLRNAPGLVVISTPPVTHYKIASEFLSAGISVLVEKPLATDVREAERLVGLAAKRGAKLFVNHTYIFHPVVRELKDSIAAGGLGEAFYFQSERGSPIVSADVSAVWDLGPHDFYLVLHLFPEMRPRTLRVIAARRHKRSQVDHAHVFMEYEDGFIAHFHLTKLSPEKVRFIRIGGSRGAVTWDDMQSFGRFSYSRGDVSAIEQVGDNDGRVLIRGETKTIRVRGEEPLYAEVRSVVRSMEEGMRPEVDGEQGLEVVRLLAACDRSIRGGGGKIRLARR